MHFVNAELAGRDDMLYDLPFGQLADLLGAEAIGRGETWTPSVRLARNERDPRLLAGQARRSAPDAGAAGTSSPRTYRGCADTRC